MTHYDWLDQILEIGVIRRCRTLAALDRFGLKLANNNHQWTLRERREFEKRVRKLKA